ncbi:glycoside hydrolase family 13 protein [Ligilactobacillus salivarius]
MAHILYNAWDSLYKEPFGAVKIEHEVVWRLQVFSDENEEIHYVNLILTKDGEEDVPYALENLNHDGLYQVKLQIGTAGLYFYHFEIETSHGRSYLEKRQGGMAQQVSSQSDLLRFQLTCFDEEVPSPKWYRQGVVYQIFPDRFANGLPNGEVQGRKPNSFIYGTTADKPYYIRDKNNEIVRWNFYGGNLRGILKKLPYLEELGVTTIYLNPIFLSRSNHHYDTADFLKIDPMIGNEDDLKELITEMHKKNMHLILDGVFNHVGKESIYFNASGSYGKNVGAAQSKESPYYSWFDFIHYPDDYKSWWGIKDLPVIDKDNPEYQKFIYGDSNRSVLSKWNNFGVDGWRLDVADELPMNFLRGIRKNLDSHHKQVMIGEVWEDASNKIAYDERRQYTVGDNLTGVMGYPTRIFVMDLLESVKSSQDIKKYCNEYLQLQENYPRDFWLNTLNNIGTHDTQRIKTVLHNDDNKVIQAFRILFNLPGVPCIYYGDEVGVEGDADPDNRRFFPWGQEKNSRIIQEVKQLVDKRKKNTLLQEGRLGFVIARGSHCPALAIVRYDDQGNSVYNWLNLTQYKQIISPENCEYLCLPQNIQQKFQHELTLDSWEYKVI